MPEQITLDASELKTKAKIAIPTSSTQNFNNLLSILPPRQNNPVAAVLSILHLQAFPEKYIWFRLHG